VADFHRHQRSLEQTPLPSHPARLEDLGSVFRPLQDAPGSCPVLYWGGEKLLSNVSSKTNCMAFNLMYLVGYGWEGKLVLRRKPSVPKGEAP
jgi:hypothetical protein